MRFISLVVIVFFAVTSFAQAEAPERKKLNQAYQVALDKSLTQDVYFLTKQFRLKDLANLIARKTNTRTQIVKRAKDASEARCIYLVRRQSSRLSLKMIYRSWLLRGYAGDFRYYKLQRMAKG
jgi:hypothetical protein